jgi:hypothetical protein
MTPTQISYIKENFLISATYLRQVMPERAIVRVAWTRYGILDVNDPSTLHLVSIEKNGQLLPGYPLYLNDDDAYNSRYSIVLDDWDPNSTYKITVNINTDVEGSLVVVPPAGANRLPPLPTFQPGLVTARLRNTERGVKIDIGGPCADCSSYVRNVTIERSIGAASTPAPLYTSSVPVSYTLDQTVTNYPYAVVDGQSVPMTSTIFTDIFTDRKDMLVYVERFNLQQYEEVVDPIEIASYTDEETVTVTTLAALVPSIHNEPHGIYQTLDDEKYYRFRDVQLNIPMQATQLSPESISKWYPLEGFDDALLTFDLYIDGTSAVGPSENVVIGAAMRNERQDFTSFNILGLYTSPDLFTLLPAGVTFMDRPLSHIDRDVLPDTLYKYKVTIETIDGLVFPIFVGTIEYQLPSRGNLPEDVDEEDLLNPVNPDATLNELDFQSGPANGHLKVNLSDDPEDYRQFLINRNKNRRSGCLI